MSDEKEATGGNSKRKHLLRVTTVTREMWEFLQQYADEKGLSTRSAAARFILNAAMREWYDEIK